MWNSFGRRHQDQALQGSLQGAGRSCLSRKADVDANFVRLSHLLLESPVYNALATHDEAMVDA